MEPLSRMVAVTWHDNIPRFGWMLDESVVPRTSTRVTAVGFILADSERELIICQGFDATDNLLNTFSIAKSAITFITDLAFKKEE